MSCTHDTRVLEERAYRYPRGKAALLFRREGDDITLGERNRTKGRAVTEVLRPNSLLLSAAAAANHPDLAPLHRWFTENLLLAEASSRARRWAYTTGLLQQEQRQDEVLALLRAADLVPRILLRHSGSEGTAEFDADEESLGTMVWFGLAGPVIDALARGCVLLVDEIEASLHPAARGPACATLPRPGE